MNNVPSVKLGLVAVSRDCFPISLSERRRRAVTAACEKLGLDICEIPTIIENECDAMKALDELKSAGANALAVYLGNFGPEGPETLLAEKFDGPCMFAAAAEEDIPVLSNERGDAFCGMLNASYALKLRGVDAYIPEYPVGTAEEVAGMMADFAPVARALIGVKNLKIITFGPRPQDFLACNAPIAPLYKLCNGVQENSELDLFEYFNARKGDKRIAAVVADMAAELGSGNLMPGILERLAQLELALTDWINANKGAAKYVALANKCWPAFQTQFGCVPCYVNSRFAARGIPVACEVDIYGALSEYIGTCVTDAPVTLLDVNNTVPSDLYSREVARTGYGAREVFMGFHCGNTPICYLRKPEMRHQLIMKRNLEPDVEPNITRGTLEGYLKAGDITFYRLQANKDSRLVSYVAEGEVLQAEPHSFGGIGVFAIPEMNRFYRHVLIADGYPHHGAVAFGHTGKALFSVMRMLGAEKVSYNQPASQLYAGENPFK